MSPFEAQLQAILAGRYRIERELGRGGAGIVYAARDLRHNRPVALKVLSRSVASAIGTDRFLREIQLSETRCRIRSRSQRSEARQPRAHHCRVAAPGTATSSGRTHTTGSWPMCSPSGHQWYGDFLWSRCRLDDALEQMKEAQRPDPLSLVINSELGSTYYLTRRYHEAEATFREVLALDPNYAHSVYLIVWSGSSSIDTGRR